LLIKKQFSKEAEGNAYDRKPSADRVTHYEAFKHPNELV